METSPLDKWFARTGRGPSWLAEQTGIDQSLLSKYRRLERIPGVKNACAIESATEGAIPARVWARFEPRSPKAA